MNDLDPTIPSSASTLPHSLPDFPDLSRRGFLRTAAFAGGGLFVAGLAACTGSAPTWTYPPNRTPSPSATPTGSASGVTAVVASPGASSVATASPSDGSMPGMSMPPPPSVSGLPAASPSADQMDAAMEAVIKRFPEKTDKVGNQPLAPVIDGDWKVFELDCSAFNWQIDAKLPTVAAVGYNGMWPGPLLRVTEGDQVRVHVTNHLDESTAVHFHGQALPNKMDGVPGLTQDPIKPGGTFTYEFVAKPAGSHMYHSHHNATDQVGRGLLGAFIVDPLKPSDRYDVDVDYLWISNDTLGGFTINGKGFPATSPVVAKLGQRVLIRFMNEGLMTHPWHLHGMHFQVVARDGYPLGSAAFRCDTLGVNPGERWDVIVEADNPGVWAFHCHILTHAEGPAGMFGMVNAFIVSA